MVSSGKGTVNAQPNWIECDAILFDLDGVLIDSTTCVERHWRNWAEKYGLDAVRILRIAHGVRNVDTMRLLVPHLDVEKEAALFPRWRTLPPWRPRRSRT